MTHKPNLDLLESKNLDLPDELNMILNLNGNQGNSLSDNIKKNVSLNLNDFNIELYHYILEDLQYKDASKEYQREIKIFLEKELKDFLAKVFK